MKVKHPLLDLQRPFWHDAHYSLMLLTLYFIVSVSLPSIISFSLLISMFYFVGVLDALLVPSYLSDCYETSFPLGKRSCSSSVVNWCTSDQRAEDGSLIWKFIQLQCMKDSWNFLHQNTEIVVSCYFCNMFRHLLVKNPDTDTNHPNTWARMEDHSFIVYDRDSAGEYICCVISTPMGELFPRVTDILTKALTP